MRRLAPITVMVLLVLASGAAFARTHKSQAKGAAATAAPKSVTLQGTVRSIDANSSLLRIVEPKKKGLFHKTRVSTVAVGPQTQITFQGSALTLADLKKGSRVQIAAEKSGRKLVATTIEVTKEPVKTTAKSAPAPRKHKGLY